MKKFSLPFGLLAVAVVFLTACSSKNMQPVVESTASQPSGLIAEGRLLPVNSMEQSFSISGQVAEILVKDGDRVQEGQVLARLQSSPDIQLAMAHAQQEELAAQQALDGLMTVAEVNLAQGRLAVIAAQNQFEAAQEDFSTNISDELEAKLDVAKALLAQAKDAQAKLETSAGVDPDQMAAAEARLASAQAAGISAQAAVDSLELKATLDGTVVDTTLQAGQRVTAGQPVFSLADFSSWVVKTDNLTENEVVTLQVGQKVTVILDALPSVILSGEITHINARYEEKRGDITYTVTVTLNQADPAMRWGMTAAVQFVP